MKAPNTYDDLLASDPTRYSRTGPPAEHGRTHLALGLLGALLLSSLMNSCAAPARLPERPVSQHDYLDARTKHAEPQPIR